MLVRWGRIRSVLRESLALWVRQAMIFMTRAGMAFWGMVDSICTLAIESATPIESKVSRASRLCLDQEEEETLVVCSSSTIRSKQTAISKAPQVTKKTLSSLGVDIDNGVVLDFFEGVLLLLRLKESELYALDCAEGASRLETGTQVAATKDTKHSKTATVFFTRSFSVLLLPLPLLPLLFWPALLLFLFLLLLLLLFSSSSVSSGLFLLLSLASFRSSVIVVLVLVLVLVDTELRVDFSCSCSKSFIAGTRVEFNRKEVITTVLPSSSLPSLLPSSLLLNFSCKANISLRRFCFIASLLSLLLLLPLFVVIIVIGLLVGGFVPSFLRSLVGWLVGCWLACIVCLLVCLLIVG
mmetsp:Transcript_4675/g.10248  ORF Transcript_4675/g.10248 Transcript_4675/m.10248 type:complete len:353 (-) Transcript_4675:119-1177(-)